MDFVTKVMSLLFYMLSRFVIAWAQLVKNPPAVWESWVQSLSWEDPLEKGKATHSSILAWRIPWTTVHGVAKSWTSLSNFHFHGSWFLPRSKCLLILCLPSPSTVILEPRKIKSVTVSSCSPSICHEVMGLDAMILVF